jgi:hypothetical protein
VPKLLLAGFFCQEFKNQPVYLLTPSKFFHRKNMKKSLAKLTVLLLLLLFHLTGSICFSRQDTNKELSPTQSTITAPSQEGENLIEDVNVEMKISTVKRSFHYPEPIKLQVFLFKPYPVLGARVEGTIVSPSGSTFKVPFSENILIDATTPESGSYVAIITDLQEDGRYVVKIRADDNKGRAHFAGFPTAEKGPSGVGSFEIERLVSIQVSGYEGMPGLPPLRIDSLYAEVDDDQCILLSWQVPLNIGQGGSYEIRYSHERIDSREAWAGAEVLHRGQYSQRGGETQSYRSCELGEGRYYFAVISENKMGAESEISNNYIVVLQ